MQIENKIHFLFVVTSVNPYRSSKMYRVSIIRVWSNTFINPVLITLSKFTKNTEKNPHPKLSSYQLSAILSAFCDLSKSLPRALTWGWNCLQQEFLALTVGAVRRRCALTQYFPNPQTPFLLSGNSSDRDLCLIDTLIF